MAKPNLNDERTQVNPLEQDQLGANPTPIPPKKKSQLETDIEAIMQSIVEISKAQRELNERWGTEFAALRALARGGKF